MRQSSRCLATSVGPGQPNADNDSELPSLNVVQLKKPRSP